MASKGGARPGSGRPTLAKELATADIARGTLIRKYGTLEKAMEFLLTTDEPTLIKFVYEHAFGKSPDKIEHSGEVSHVITGMEVK